MRTAKIAPVFFRHLTGGGVVLLAIALIWCLNYNRIKLANWQVPVSATSDSLTVLAVQKSSAEGNFPPLRQKFQPHFGAPYIASWNDFPITEEPLILLAGWLTKAMGLFAASNLVLLLAHVLAGLSFYFVGRALGGRAPWTFVGALIFAFSTYAFRHGYAHLALTYYWHLPLGFLVCLWCGQARGLGFSDRRRLWFSVAVALVTGIQNPYYTNLFVQFLGFAVLAQAFRRQWKKTVVPLLLGTLAITGFALMNLDTISYQIQHGPNAEAGARNYQGLEIYALKPLDLFMPPLQHRSTFARAISRDYLYDDEKKVYLRGEMFGSYLGLAGIAALLWLGGISVAQICRQPRRPVPMAALLVGWIFLFSVVGGLNGFLGQLGINLFRCTSRYSIGILAIVLLFAVRELSRLSQKWHPALSLALAAGIAVLALWDQLPKRESQAGVYAKLGALTSDRVFTEELEKALPDHAMVFQLPAMRFPESWPINGMGDYEHFRPFIFSRALRFSYGDTKGRGQDEWQYRLAELPAEELIDVLERAGFSALYLNRKGYTDNAEALLAKIKSVKNYPVIGSPAGDLIAVLLKPVADPELPARPPEFRPGWYEQEGADPSETWHYSKGPAELVLHNNSAKPRRVIASFDLSSPSPRTVELWSGEKKIYQSPSLTSERVKVELALTLAPGANHFSFRTDGPVIFPSSPDTRPLGFRLWNFSISNAGDGL